MPAASCRRGRFRRRQNLPNWRDLAPRLGVAYDLFGNAKTALKFSLNRYNDSRTTGIAAQYNPFAQATARLTWRDLNGDDIAQGLPGCVYLTAGCEINFAQMPANFGVRSLRTYDPSTTGAYNVLSNIGIQHQLLPRLSVSGSLVQTSLTGSRFRDNMLRTRADYTPVTVVSPFDGEVITVYNLRPAKLSQVSEVDTTASSDPKAVVHRIRVHVQRRLPGGATLFGGTSTDRNLTVTCDDPDNPNNDRFCDQRDTPVPYRRS